MGIRLLKVEQFCCQICFIQLMFFRGRLNWLKTLKLSFFYKRASSYHGLVCQGKLQSNQICKECNLRSCTKTRNRKYSILLRRYLNLFVWFYSNISPSPQQIYGSKDKRAQLGKITLINASKISENANIKLTFGFLSHKIRR